MSSPRLELTAPHDEPVLVFRRAFKAPASLVFEAWTEPRQAGQTWPAMRRELQRIAIGTFTGPAGTFRQRTDIPKTARDLLATLKIDVPRKIHELTPPKS